MEYAFGDCVLSARTRTLRRGGSEVQLQPKVLDLLLYLIAHRGRVVSQPVLERDLWPDATVTNASLLRLVKEARRAVGDDGRRQALIKTVHGRGYRFAPAVRELGGGERVYVGREPLLDALESNLLEAARGNGRLVLIEGPPGIGKTSTLLEVAERARLLDLDVVHTWAYDAPTTPAFWPWLQALRGVIEKHPEVPIPPEIAPLLEAGDSPSRSAPRLDAAGEQFRLFDAARRLLVAAASRRPLALAIDDLHAADPGSLALLEFLEPGFGRAPIFAIGSYRPEEVELHPRRTRPLQKLTARASVAHWPLSGLGESEVGRIVEQRTGLEATSRLARMLTERTDGNPFFIEEILRHVVSRAELDAAALAREVEALLPSSVQAIIDRRLNAISDRSESVLRCAAVIGHDFELRVLERVVDGEAVAVGDALREGAEARLVVRSRRTPPRYAFAHPLIQEHLALPLTGAEERRKLHARIARALAESRGPENARVEAVAHHLTAALPAGSVVEAVHARAAAARLAASRYAFEQSAEHYERSLELLEQSGESHDVLRCELLLELGDLRLGAEGRDAAKNSFARAAGIARSLGLGDQLMRAALGFAYRRVASGDADERVVGLLTEALEVVPEEAHALRARIRSRLGVELLYTAPRERGEAMIAEAVAEARAAADDAALASVLECQTYALWSPRDPKGFLALNQELHGLALAANDADLAFRGLKSQATAQLELGDGAAVVELLGACERFAEQHPLTYARWVTAGMRAMLAMLSGRLDDAEAAIAETRAAGERDEAALMAVLAQTYALKLLQGRLAELEEPLTRLARGYPRLHAARAALGRAYLEAERAVDARGELEAIARDELDDLPFDRNRLLALAICAELCEGLRAAGLSERLLCHLAPHADVHVVIGSSAVYYGAVAHHVGLLQLARSAWREAEVQLERAARAHARIGSPPWVAETRHALARLYLQRAGRGDAERARRRAHDALELAEAHGLAGLARRAHATLAAARRG